MTTKRARKKSAAVKALEGLIGEPLSLAMAVRATREGEDLGQAEFAQRLGLSRSHLCDIEKGRKAVSPERAAEFARKLGYSERQWVRLALQDLVDRAGLRLKVEVRAA